ncbi:MAG: histidine phosphatase family protein [Planctomycetota bacterium]
MDNQSARDTADSSADRILIVMRHAKSDWGDSSLSDHDRPLNARGQRDAPRMADWLADSGWTPDVVLSSSSLRTRQTLQLMNDRWQTEPTALYSESLYLAAPDTILDCIHSDGIGAKHLMVLAHNPGIAYFASTLANESLDMPTAAVAVFQLHLDQWSDLRVSTPMQMVEFMRPKAL